MSPKSPLSHSFAHWETIEHILFCTRTWIFVGGHGNILVCDGLEWADHLHYTSVFWLHILKLGGGWPFFNNIKGKTVILWKTRDLPETQKFSPSWLHQSKGVMNEGDPTHPSLNSPWPAQSKASSFSLVFEVEVMNYLLLLCLHP